MVPNTEWSVVWYDGGKKRFFYNHLQRFRQALAPPEVVAAYPTGEHSNEPLCGSTGVVNAAVGAAAARCPLLPQRLCLTRSESGKIGP